MDTVLYFPIDEVTLYQGTCKVDRKKRHFLAKGENQLIISGLPQDIRKTSVKIEVVPADDVRIKNFYTEDRIKESGEDDRIAELKKELDSLRQKKSTIEARITNLNDQLNLFIEKGSISGQINHEQNKPVNVKLWDDFFTFFREFIKKNRTVNRKLLFEWLDLQVKVRTAEDNYAGYTHYETNYEHIACLTLEAEKEGEADIVISYFQDKAAWHPAYKLTASEEEKKVQLTLYGIIRQSTGEDWEDIGLGLSTARGLASCELPLIKSRKIKEHQRAIFEAGPVFGGIGGAPAESVYEAEEAVLFDSKADRFGDVEMEKSVSPGAEKRLRKKIAPGRAESKKSDILSQDEIDSLLTAAASKPAPSPVVKKKKERAEKISSADNQFYSSLKGIDSLTDSVDAQMHPDLRSRKLSYFHSLLENQLFFTFKPELQMTGGTGIMTPQEFLSPLPSAAPEAGTDWMYRVPGRYNRIPSLDRQVQVEVLTADIEGDFNYVAVPLESEAAYLQARLVNTTGIPYPAGPCQLVLNNAFLGTGIFETLGPHKKGTVSLGLDHDIRVVRTESVRHSRTGLVNKDIQSRYSITIGLENNKQHQVQIEVLDRIPNSVEKKEISLEKRTFSVEPESVSKENIITWLLELGPGEKKSICFEYTIKAPENFRLVQQPGTTAHQR